MSLKPDNFRPALLIVDFQEDFCPPVSSQALTLALPTNPPQNGSLAVQDGRGIAPTVNGLLRLPFALKVATRDWHPRDHISFASNHPAPENIPFISHTTIIHPSDPTREYTTRLWPDHCIQGSPGAELVPELDLSLVDEIVDKGQDPRLEMYSAFTDPFHLPPFTPDSVSICTSQLAQTLAERKISHVYVVGLTQDYCVKDSAIDAAKFGFKTFVIREGTRAVDPGKWDQAERDMAGAGVATIGLEDREVQDWVRNFKKD